MSPKQQSGIDGYLASVPADARGTLEKLRQTIKAASPDAVELLSYGVLGFKYQGRPLVYIGAAKNHCAIYGAVPDAFKDELADYDLSKGTIRFPHDKAPPDALVEKLIKARAAAIDGEAAERKRKTGAGRAR